MSKGILPRGFSTETLLLSKAPTKKGYWKGRWSRSIFAGFATFHEGGGFYLAGKRVSCFI